MTNKYESISILWESRVEDLNIISERILKALNFIENELPNIYNNWYELGYSKENALSKNVEITKKEIFEILHKNQDQNYPNLGTKISLWNGAEDENKEASFSAKFNSDSIRIKNNFVLRLPFENDLTISKIQILIGYLNSLFNGTNIRINGKEIDKNYFIQKFEESEKVHPYRTHEGKDYTQEEWEKYEAEQWKKFKDKE